MRLCPAAPFVVLLLTILSGCSSDGNDGDSETLDDGSEVVSENPELPATEEPTDPTTLASELIGRWRLSGYTLDDGTSKTVPDDSEVGIEIRSTGTLSVNLCPDFTVSYDVSDGILTTADAVFSDPGCAPFPDVDADERNGLSVERAVEHPDDGRGVRRRHAHRDDRDQRSARVRPGRRFVAGGRSMDASQLLRVRRRYRDGSRSRRPQQWCRAQPRAGWQVMAELHLRWSGRHLLARRRRSVVLHVRCSRGRFLPSGEHNR